MKNRIKVMSFNLRLDTAYDGANRFSNRVDLIKKVIDREGADLIGFQEVLPSMRDWLRENLKGYTVLGCGRGKKLNDESMTIAFKNDRFELLGLENQWLSPTPDVPGTVYDGQSSCPRMFTSALLYFVPAGKRLRFINTHFDHEGKSARLLSSKQIVAYLNSQSDPFVLTGDFNASPDSPEIRYITSAKVNSRPICDCTAGLPGTWHDFGRIPEERRVRIDYIFTDLTCRAASIAPDERPGGRYYSDHFAICAEVE